MTTADKWVRGTTLASVIVVAGVAGWISYNHAVAVVVTHGEPGVVGHWYPAVIDGLIVAASMVLLDSARHRADAPRLALWLLSAGIAATLVINVLAGVAFGPLGAIVSAWPALSFVGCYELLMMLVRASAQRASGAADETALPPAELWVPEDAEDAAAEAMRMSVIGGNPLSANALQSKFNLTRATARDIRTQFIAIQNGHKELEPAE